MEPPETPIAGRHYQTGQPITIHHTNGVITRVEAFQTTAPECLPFIAPPLVDLQVNGFAGVDFQQDNLSPEQLNHACQGLLAAGCTRFLLTLITDSWPHLTQRLAHLHKTIQASPLAKTMVVGWHIEGPFLSDQPGFHGAHPKEHMIDPTPEALDKIRQILGDAPVLLTLAPERSGSARAIQHASRLGFHISLGHTNASAVEIQSAISAGATCFTHLGNGCTQQLDRHDNILWRVLDHLRPHTPATTSTTPFTATLIPDGHHISPILFRIIHAASTPGRLMYVSDAMAGAGAPPGPTTLGPLKLNVGTDGIVRQPGQTNFAGSALQPLDGVFRASQMLNAPWQECWERFSSLPATWMKLPPNDLKPEQPASACCLQFHETTNTPRLTAVFLNGKQVYQAAEHV